jgi:hypothetical protein
MKICTWLKNVFEEKPTIKFKSFVGNSAVSNPVLPANKIRPEWTKNQEPEYKFQRCPGMLDFSHAGYIITAHSDIHIKANKSGVVFNVDLQGPYSEQDRKLLQAKPFDYRMVAGMAPIADGVKKVAYKIPLPWSVYTKKGYSAYVLPVLNNSDYLDKLFVYPGIVDYEDYHTINFVISPLKECEFVIPAGTPLLQVIPFKREKITAECGKATQDEYDEHAFSMPTRAIKGYYRRFLSKRKIYTMECPYEHPQYKK